MERDLKILDNKYIIKGIISQTKNSKIHFGYSINNPSEKLIIKAFKSQNFSKSSFENLLKEMKKLKNSNIISIINGGNGMIKLLNKIIKNNVFYIINEYEPKGELFSYITSYEKGFGEEISKILFYQILSGLNYITNNGFFIEKIKLDNLLLDNNYIIKISDFFLENINNKSNFNVKNYDLASILFSLVTGRDPKILGKKITKEKLDKFWLSSKLIIDKDYLSLEFIDLFNKITLDNDFNSYTNDDMIIDLNYYQKILLHPWFNGLKIENILFNKNNCYEFVKDEFEKRFKLMNNNFIQEPIIENIQINNFNQLNLSITPLIERTGDFQKKLTEKKKKKNCYDLFINFICNIFQKNYFSKDAKCIQYKFVLNNLIKIIPIKINDNLYEYMNRIVKICKKFSRVETNKKKFKIYCYLNENNEDEKLIIKISLRENKMENKYELMIQKISGDYFDYLGFYNQFYELLTNYKD